jgi:hypothetical protein
LSECLKQKIARSVKSCGRSCERRWYGYAERKSSVFGDAMLEAENWKIVAELYKGRPILALLLAHQLMAIRQTLQRGRKGIPDAIDGLDLAISSLFPYTDFHKLSRRLYLRRLEGTLKPKEEEKLRHLGLKL